MPAQSEQLERPLQLSPQGLNGNSRSFVKSHAILLSSLSLFEPECLWEKKLPKPRSKKLYLKPKSYSLTKP